VSTSNTRKPLNRLRELRKESGLTQAQLSEKSGVCESAIGYSEAVGSSIRLDNLVKLATALRCDVRDLIAT